MKDDHQNKQHQSNAQGSEEALSHKTSGKNESEDTLTNRQGHPVTDNQNVRTVGNRGPTTLENYDFLEKISHFDRERIPERVVHAREQVHMDILKRTEASETNRFQHTQGPSSFRKKARKHRHLSVFQL